MKRTLSCALLSLAACLGASAGPVRAQAPEAPGSAVERLAASVDRLVALLEREAASRAEERNARRVEVAADILALRYRKVEQLQNEIRDISREEEELPGAVAMMKAEKGRLEDYASSEGDHPGAGVKGEIEAMEVRIRIQEDHLERLRERRLLLENDLAAEQRRSTSVEAVLDEWLAGLE